MSIAGNLVPSSGDSNRFVVVFIAGSLSDFQAEQFAIKELSVISRIILIDPSLLLGQREICPRLSSSLENLVQVVSVESFRELYNFLLRVKPDVVFDLASIHAIGLVRSMLRKKAPFALVQIVGNALPIPTLPSRLAARIRKLGTRDSSVAMGQSTARRIDHPGIAIVSGFVMSVQNWLAQRFLPGPDTVVFAGKASLLSLASRRARTRVQVRHVDMELVDKATQLSSKPIAVFIDEAFATSDDYAKLGINVPSGLDDYYSGVARMLKAVESEFQVKFSVCLHPDSLKFVEEIGRHLADFEILERKTHSALISAKLVLFHRSTVALAAAQLGVKTVAVLLPDQCGLENQFVRSLAKVCKADLISFDGEPVSTETKTLLSSVAPQRQRFAEDYLGDSQTLLHELFLGFLNSLDGKTGQVGLSELLPFRIRRC